MAIVIPLPLKKPVKLGLEAVQLNSIIKLYKFINMKGVFGQGL